MSGRYKRVTVSLHSFETQVNHAERCVQRRYTQWGTPPAGQPALEWQRGLLTQLHQAITDARIMWNNLTDEQVTDTACVALRRRLCEVERLRRMGGNPLGRVQERIDAALALLAEEEQTPLTEKLRAALLGS